jgi:hypothetical protein
MAHIILSIESKDPVVLAIQMVLTEVGIIKYLSMLLGGIVLSAVGSRALGYVWSKLVSAFTWWVKLNAIAIPLLCVGNHFVPEHVRLTFVKCFAYTRPGATPKPNSCSGVVRSTAG